MLPRWNCRPPGSHNHTGVQQQPLSGFSAGSAIADPSTEKPSTRIDLRISSLEEKYQKMFP